MEAGVAAGSTATGDLNHTDVDNVDDVFTAGTLAGTYGSLAIGSDGTWTYTINDGNATVDALNVGDSLTDTITVTTEDGTTADITVTIEGANDAAVVGGDSTGTAVEAGVTAGSTATGDLNHTDVDNDDDVFIAGTLAGTYGSLAIGSDGTWTYTVDDSNATVDALNVGDSLTDTITVTTEDGTTADITVTIGGANDAAIIGGVSTGTALEAGVAAGSTAIGDLDHTDVDNDDDVFTAGTLAGAYGSLAIGADGTWTYTVDDSNATVDALNVGDSLTDTITAVSYTHLTLPTKA